MIKLNHRLLYDRRLIASGLIILFTLLSPLKVFAEIEETEIEESNGTVIVDLKADPYASYSEKKTDWSTRFGFGVENFIPDSYVSSLDSSTYTSLFGKNGIQIMNAGLGIQYNFSYFSAYIDIFYGIGTLTNRVSQSSIAVAKYGGDIGIFLDHIFDNPYVSPFASVEAFASDWRESDLASSLTTGSHIEMMTGYKVGISVHLDKIDTAAALEAYKEYGLKNSFFDIYAFQTLKSQDARDPNFYTLPNIGLTFRLEL